MEGVECCAREYAGDMGADSQADCISQLALHPPHFPQSACVHQQKVIALFWDCEGTRWSVLSGRPTAGFALVWNRGSAQVHDLGRTAIELITGSDQLPDTDLIQISGGV